MEKNYKVVNEDLVGDLSEFEWVSSRYRSEDDWASGNADFNAANNIKNRVSITVLCNSLLKQLDNGAYEPKKLKREKVKEVLLSFRRNLQKVGSECRECGMTYDYIWLYLILRIE